MKGGVLSGMVSGFPLGSGNAKRRVMMTFATKGTRFQSSGLVRVEMPEHLDKHLLAAR